MSNYSAIDAGRASVKITAEDATASGMDKAEGRLRKLAGAMQEIGRTGFLNLGAGLAPAVQSVRVYTAFSDQMAVVRAVSAATAQEFSALTARAEELGSTTSFTATNVAAAMTELAKAGFKPQETLTAIAGTLDTARAGNLELAEATTITTDTLRSFSLQADQAGRVGDVLAKTANISSTDMGQIGQALKYVASAANMSGQSLESVNGALAVLANRGLKADMAGTSLAQVFLKLSDSGVQKTLKQMGVAVMDVNGDMRSLVDIMGELGQQTAGMGNTQKLGIFKDLFDDRGMRAAGLLSANAKEWRDAIRTLRQSQGEAARVAKDMDNSIGGSWRSMASAVEGTQITFGRALEAPLRTAYGLVTDLARSVSDFIKENQGLVATLTTGAGALAIFSGGLYAVGTATKVLSYGLSGLKEIANWAKILRDRYREQLAQITSGASAQQAQAASTNAAAAAEEKLATTSATATAAMKGQSAELTRMIALLDKLVASATGAAAALQRQMSAQTASAGGWASVYAALQAVLAVTLEVGAALAAETAALRANTVASAKQAQSVKALVGWQTKLAAATIKATGALRAQAAASAEQTTASATSARAAAAQAQTYELVSVAAARNTAATAALTVATERYALATTVSNASMARIGKGAAVSSLKDVAATVVETSGGMALLATASQGAAKDLATVATKATLAQKALAGVKAGMATVGFGTGAILAGIGGLAIGGEWKEAVRYKPQMRDTAEDARIGGIKNTEMNQLEEETSRILELASNTHRTVAEHEELLEALTEINDRYKIFNGSVEDAAKSQNSLAASMLAVKKQALESQKETLQLNELNAKENFSEAQKKRFDLFKGRKFSVIDILTGNDKSETQQAIEEENSAGERLAKVRETIAALNKKIAKIDKAQKSGGGSSGDGRSPAKDLYTGLNEEEYKSAQEKLTSIEEQYRRDRQTGLENEIDDIRRLGAEYQKLLKQLADAARHQGTEDVAAGYEEKLKAAGAETEKLVQEANRKEEQKQREKQEKLASDKAGDLRAVDELLAQDQQQRSLREEDGLIDEVTTADPAQAATMLQAQQQKMNETIIALQQKSRELIQSAYEDGQKTPEEGDAIDGVRTELQQALSRRTELGDALTRAQDAVADPKTWEVRGAFGAAAGALGTGTNSVDDKQAKSLDNIDGNTKKLQELFEKGIKLTVA